MLDLNSDKMGYNKSMLLSTLLPFYYILAQYEVPIFTIGTWLLLLLVIESLLSNYIIINKWISIFFLYTLIVEFFFHSSSMTINSILNIIFSIIFIFSFSYKIDLETFYKSYKIVGVICSVVISIQFFMMFVLKITMKSSISIFPSLTHGIFEWERILNRPSAFFSEPQAYASYVIPLLLLTMKKKEYKYSLFLTLCIFLSTSSQGIITVTIIWLIYSSFYVKSISKKIVLYFSLGLSSFAFISIPGLEFAREKILNTDFTNNVRLTRGFQTYMVLPLVNKLFGIGFLNQTNFFKNSNIYLNWYHLSVIQEFITTIAGVIVYFGIFAGLIFLTFFIRYYLDGEETEKMFCIVIILSMFSQNLLYNSWFIFYFIIAFNLELPNNRSAIKVRLF